MPDSVPWYIGLRYSGTRANNLFLSFIAWISLIGVTLGVVALTIVVSVMNGFDSELKRRILGAVPHVVATGIDDPAGIEAHPRVRAVVPFMRGRGMLINAGETRLIALYGIEPGAERAVSNIPTFVDGDLRELLPAGSNQIVIGRGLAYQAGIARGDRIMVVIPEPSAGGNTITPRFGQVTVAGFFELGSELDYRLGLMNIEDLGAITGRAQTAWRLALDDVFVAPVISRWLRDRLGPDAEISDWTREYGNFFETVRMEKIMMFVLLSLVIVIAAFNIISSLSMMVKEKQADIAVLRTLGMSPRRVMMIFVVQGGSIGALGTLVGVLLGVPLALWIPEIIGFFEELWGARVLAGTYFERVPSDVRVPDVAVILAVSLTITIMATLYPAWRAARLRPAEVLHAEV